MAPLARPVIGAKIAAGTCYGSSIDVLTRGLGIAEASKFGAKPCDLIRPAENALYDETIFALEPYLDPNQYSIHQGIQFSDPATHRIIPD